MDHHYLSGLRRCLHIVLWAILILFLVGENAGRLYAGNEIDSLRNLILHADTDTLRAKYYNNLGTALFNTNLDSAQTNWEISLAISERNAESPDTTVAKAGKLMIMRTSSNIAVVFQYRGLYPQALRYYQRCLVIANEFHNKRGTCMTLNNIGLIKLGQEKPDEAILLYERSLRLARELQDTALSVATINNIGVAQKRLKRYPEALANFRESLRLSRLTDNGVQIVDDLLNIGSIFLEDRRLDEALLTFEQCYHLADSLQYALAKPEVLMGLAHAHLDLRHHPRALTYAQAAVDTSRALDMTEETIGALELLAQVQRLMGDHPAANATLLTYIALKDSIFNQEKAEEFGQLEKGFEHERLQYEKELTAGHEAAALSRKNFEQYLISFGVVAVIALLLVIGMRLAKQERLRYFVVFGALLVFFEFLLVLLDNFVDGFTGGLPIPKLLANVFLAALIAPLNVFLERRLVDGKHTKPDA
jgi:tetratricopeptide (TPR) repeat protein